MSQRVSAVLVAWACACGPAKEQARAPQATTSRAAGASHPPGSAVPPAARPAPSAPAPPTRAVQAAIGTAQPLTVQAVSATGNWVGFCQARADSDSDGKVEVKVGPRGELGGDSLSGYLALPNGESAAIDDLAAYDLAGKYLVYLRGGRTLLADVERGTELDLEALGADTRRDALRYRPHRSLALDAQGQHLLYVKRANGKSGVVLRELSSGNEQNFDPGPGEIWRAELEPSGRFIVLRMIRDDTDKNGRLEWPVPEAKPGGVRCASPIATYSDHSGRGDRDEVVLIPRVPGKPQSPPNFVTLLGDGVVRRESDGRLLLERATGTLTLTSDKCGGRVIHADSERNLLIVGCQVPKNKIRYDLVLVGPGFVKPLGLDLAQTELDRTAASSPRLVGLYPGSDTVLLDMDQKAVIKLEPGDHVVATFANRALIRRQNRLLYVTVDPAGSTELGVELDKNPDVLVQGGFAYVSPWLVDLVSGKPYGPAPKRALGLTRTGELLLAEGGDPSAERLAIGPLRWLDLTP